MRLEMLLGGRDHLQGNELVSSLLEAADDVADESTLDAIWLYGNEAGMRISRPLVCSCFLRAYVCSVDILMAGSVVLLRDRYSWKS